MNELNLIFKATFPTSEEMALKLAILKGYQATINQPKEVTITEIIDGVETTRTEIRGYETIDNPQSPIDYVNQKGRELLVDFINAVFVDDAQKKLATAQQAYQEEITASKAYVDSFLTIETVDAVSA